MPLRTGTYRDGHVELDDTVDWPDGTRVLVADGVAEIDFLIKLDRPDTPENRAEFSRRIQALEPVMTLEEQAEFDAILAESKRFNKEAVRKQWGL